MSHTENHVLPAATNDSWRAWLMTGARRTGVDRRRMRGAHKGLKKILLEGLANGGDEPHVWKDFSGAMVRHAVDDAMNSLPPEDTRVVKLAYFGGYSNREIARWSGMTEGTVQRRLRHALGAISEHIQHGRVMARRAVYGLSFFLSARWLSESTHQLLAATAVAGAVVVIATAAPAPGSSTGGAAAGAPATHAVQQHQQLQQTMPVVPPVPSPTVPATAGAPSVEVPVVQVPPVNLPLQVPVNPPVKVPSLKPLTDKVQKLL